MVTRRTTGERRIMVRRASTRCAPAVRPGTSYSASSWYRADGTARWVVYLHHVSTDRWVRWRHSGTLPTRTRWTRTRFATPEVPAWADRMSIGIALRSTGTLVVDDFALTARPKPTTPRGRQWFVSRSGDGSDGRSWGTAWRDFSAIAWAGVRPGDEIVVDGGSTRCPSGYDFADHAAGRPGLRCGMQYTTVLRPEVSGTAGLPITIRLSSESGRNGTVVLFGGRSSMLPSCNQQSYQQSGTALPAGVVVPGRSHIVIDGGHRSGFMVYGAAVGVDLKSDATHHVTLRNLEIFDNGSVSTWAHGYRTDNEGIALVGHDITIERAMIHDNGQDAIQDRYTGPVNNDSHAAMSNIVLRDSWLYNRRDHPTYAGYSFNSGSQDVDGQDCTHVDGVQVWGGGLHQRGFTVSHVVFGPLLAQGFYPGDWDNASFDDVRISNSLFLNATSHSIIGDRITGNTSTPGAWVIDHVTSYLTNGPAPGTGSHGSVDLMGSGHTVTNSIFTNGYFFDRSVFTNASGNVYRGGDPVPGGVSADPRFASVPTTNAPRFADLWAADLTASCAGCASKGADIGRAADLLTRIDSLNSE